MYLFDTDVLSSVIRRSPDPGLIARLAAVPADRQFTSSISVGELVYGAHRSGRHDHFLNLLEQRLWPNIRILAFDRTAAELYGKTRADLERAGTPLAEPDLRIACIAVTRELTLVTGNVRHFARVPALAIENWIGGPVR